MGEEGKLQEAFHYIRINFFPRWDKSNEWKVLEDPDYPRSGWCDTEGKRIIIENPGQNLTDLHCLLIHEIGHAVSSPYHGKKFQTRLLKAADRADRIACPRLANAIREDVEKHCKAEPLKARDVYSQIRDWVWEEREELSYKSVIQALASLYYIPLDEIERKYKRCRAVYEKAVKERQFEQELRRRYGIMKGGDLNGSHSKRKS